MVLLRLHCWRLVCGDYLGVQSVNLFVATPVAGWEISAPWLGTIRGLEQLCRYEHVDLTQKTQFGRSDLIFSRNQFFGEFMRTDCDVFCFYDSDQLVHPSVFLKMARSPYGIVGAPVPKKVVDRARMVAAARAGCDDPELAAATFNYTNDPTEPLHVEGEFMRIAACGFGMMVIKRRVIEEMCYHAKWFMDDHIPRPELCGRFFVEEDVLYPHQLSEDFGFCLRAREWLDERTWLYWPAEVQHMGTKMYRGKLVAE